jgi:hypothetical protein
MYVVEIPRVGWANESYTGGLILHVLTERPPDVLKRPKYLFSRIISIIILDSNYANLNPNHPHRYRLKKTCTPACGPARIEEERRNVAKRTNPRIAQLYSIQNSDADNETQCESDIFHKDRKTEEWHCCLNIFVSV